MGNIIRAIKCYNFLGKGGDKLWLSLQEFQKIRILNNSATTIQIKAIQTIQPIKLTATIILINVIQTIQRIKEVKNNYKYKHKRG